MRTTVQLEDDTAAAVENLRREKGLGVSEAVNALIRRGLPPRDKRQRFVQETRDLGLKVDVTNIADAIELLEDPTSRVP